jgi:DNA helicase-2/ATP-dependent DNA helicase PcrA
VRALHHRIVYQNELNPAQMEAVTHGRGPILVIAGAGSGKTRTIIYRVAWLVEQGVPPKKILLLSFTRKASQEMIRRAARLLDKRCERVSGGTFHSFANNVLRRYGGHLGLESNFKILDRGDSEDLIGLIRKELAGGIDYNRLPRKATLATIFSRSVNKSEPIDDIIYEEYPHFGHQIEIINQIWEVYRQRKREYQYCDYDDLLTCLHDLLATSEPVRRKLNATYEYILVDEYQDTNKVQAEIVSLLCRNERNVMVVGDDSQSIYAFRGASFENIISFPAAFPDARLIKLEENYRSTQPILDLTNTLIEQAAEKYSKRLFTCRGGGRLPVLVATAGESAQSIFVKKEIIRLVRQGIALNHIAVLFRASFHSFDLELELSRSNIAYVKYGGFKFAESAHIKDVLAHLKIFAAPYDRVSWYRVLLLVDQIGPKSAQRIFEAVMRAKSGAHGLLDAALTNRELTRLKRLIELIRSIENNSLSVVDQGEQILGYYLPILKRRYDDHPRRQRDLEQLLSIMQRYEKVSDFLDDLALEPPNTSIGEGLSVQSDHTDKLTLSTIHSAKGLEWHTVFVICALDGRFPSHYALDRPEAIEEERRLMYVATTRARENLWITYPVQMYDRASNTMLYRPSRFLEDLPEDLLERRFYNPYESV